MNGHTEVLRIFGITEITSANRGWFKNPASYVVIAQDLETNEIVGGGRIHLSGGTQPLPIEAAIGKMDSSIYELVKELSIDITGELCGLWNSRKVAGKGVSYIITRALVALASQLKMGSLWIICAEDTYRRIFKESGFRIESRLGKDGKFYYPKSDLIALTLIINDLKKLENSNDAVREGIFSLRQENIQERIEVGPLGNILVQYEINISNVNQNIK